MISELKVTLKVTVLTLAFILVALWAYSKTFRYTVQVLPNGQILRVDRLTDHVWLLAFSDMQESVSNEVDTVKNRLVWTYRDDAALTLAKSAHVLSKNLSNEESIHRALQTAHGTLSILGWKCSHVTDQVCFVSYEFLSGNVKYAYCFEVNLGGSVIRNIHADAVLKQYYRNYVFQAGNPPVLEPVSSIPGTGLFLD